MIDCRYMARGTAAPASFWRTALTCGLCLLAFAFAVEAKTAWYGPVSGPGSAVRASKAMPIDLPRVIDHGIPVPDPIHPQTPFMLLAAFAILSLAAEAPVGRERAHSRFRVTLMAFSPQVFFRPPPILS
jgi:hypothetical protein